MSFANIGSLFGCKYCKLQHLLLFCIKLWGNYKLRGPVMPQAIVDCKFRVCCFASSYWGITICSIRKVIFKVLFCPKHLGDCNFEAPILCQAIEVTSCRVLLCVKLLGNYNLQGCGLPQAIGGLQFRGSCLVSHYWGSLAGAIPVRHIAGTRQIISRFRFIIHLKHAPLMWR